MKLKSNKTRSHPVCHEEDSHCWLFHFPFHIRISTIKDWNVEREMKQIKELKMYFSIVSFPVPFSILENKTRQLTKSHLFKLLNRSEQILRVSVSLIDSILWNGLKNNI